MPRATLVTGALGCVGARTVKALVAEGVPVVTYDLGGSELRLRLALSDEEPAVVTRVAGDVTDLEAIERTLDAHDVGAVIHLAALQPPFVRENPPLGAAVNVVGTTNVLEAAARRRERIAHVVYASSAAVYSPADPSPAPESGAAPPPRTTGSRSSRTKAWRGSTPTSEGCRPSGSGRTSSTGPGATRA